MKGHEDGGMFFGQEEGSVSYPCRHNAAKAVVVVEPVGIEPTTSSLQS